MKGDHESGQRPVRDGGQCAFRSAGGRRCKERRHLEFHHVRPWMAGGPTTAGNIQLRCGMHNRYEADVFYDRRAQVPEHAPAGAC